MCFLCLKIYNHNSEQGKINILEPENHNINIYVHVLPCTVEPRFYDRWSNDIPDLMISILCPGKSLQQIVWSRIPI